MKKLFVVLAIVGLCCVFGLKAQAQFSIHAGYAPEKPAPTMEEVDRERIQYRKERIDDRTLARQRKQANGTWTEEDEQDYLELDAEVTAYIEEHFPYPVG